MPNTSTYMHSLTLLKSGTSDGDPLFVLLLLLLDLPPFNQPAQKKVAEYVGQRSPRTVIHSIHLRLFHCGSSHTTHYITYQQTSSSTSPPSKHRLLQHTRFKLRS